MAGEFMVEERVMRGSVPPGGEILVIQHVASEGPGLIGEVARQGGFTLRVARMFRGEGLPADPAAFSAVVVMGGPMGVYDEGDFPFLTEELRFIEAAFRSSVPVLGVCLGAQLMARAAGGRVGPGQSKEIGFYRIRLTDEGLSDRVLLGLPREFMVFQWHGDTFTIPPGAVNLASSDLFEHQLIRLGTNSYGLQFHVEVTEPMIREFLEAGAEELRSAPCVQRPEVILAEARGLLPAIHGLGRAMVRRFLRGLG